MTRRLALFGGSFDPVHLGHLHLASAACDRFRFDTIRFLPAPNPPHKLGRAKLPIEDRLHLLEIATADDPRFVIDDYEVRRGATSFTYETLCHFRDVEPAGTHLFFLIGGDSLQELPDWYRAADLVREFDLVTVPRDPNVDERALLAPVAAALPAELVDRLIANFLRVRPLPVSSSEIRDRLRAGKSIDGMVPPAVARAIQEHRFYAQI